MRADLQGMIDDAVVHLQALISIRREVEKAIADKTEAKTIDLNAHNTNEKSANVTFKPHHSRDVDW